ncbi:PTS sugar transporter subunit IIB [Marinococcus sp. PL1-022]|uniref:PTS system mannose/fructose/N-acetylgalactosamine-transporter subunit IIB n=1 Tax=Marinococcus sp. PL1-022 TaxID=3095363 RepID=UPI0029C3358A|nr:PTS sugar transporter subunit IIB [Marinococcus sp. PL1-022]MDX6152629.1 PTS sugar transporter subunit IIB [Marinococcus sp. PL1-022]
MPISFVRIDDRVIHGQIIARWTRWKDCHGILVIDDQIAEDPMQKKIFSNAVPKSIKVGIYSLEEGVEKINKAKNAQNSYFVIVKSPIMLKKLKEKGADFGEEVNVGPISAREGAENIGRNVAITPDERVAFDYLLNEGVGISFQLVPEESAYTWEKIRNQ